MVDMEHWNLTQRVAREVERQHEKFGEQNRPSFHAWTKPHRVSNQHHLFPDSEQTAKDLVEERARDRELTYFDIFAEEVAEMIASTDDSDAQVEELVQIAAVCVSWAACILRNRVNDRRA